MRIKHWDYNTGWRTLYNIKGNTEKEFDKDLVGWHCWGYEGIGDNIAKWLADNMTGDYECDLRFNSGEPMHTIHIKSAEDATLFKLRWM